MASPLVDTKVFLRSRQQGSFEIQDHAFDMRERGLTQILTYDHKHFARVPWVQIEDF